jgi:hypothetical protein
MRTNRSDADLKVAELLRTAKDALGLSLTFLSRLDGETQHLEVVESSIPIFRDGQTQPQATSLCQAILDGKLPNVIPNVAKLSGSEASAGRSVHTKLCLGARGAQRRDALRNVLRGGLHRRQRNLPNGIGR